MMIFFIFNAREFMTLLYSEKYELSAIPFKIYLFLLPIRIVVFGSILVAMGKSKVILYRSIFELVLNIILSIWMFKLFGYLGIAVATVLVTYLWAVPYNIRIISKEFNIKKRKLFNIRQLSKIMIVACMLIPVMSIPYSITEVNIVYVVNFFDFSLPEGVLFFLGNINPTYADTLKIVISFLIYVILVVVFYRYFNIINYKNEFKHSVLTHRENNEFR
jgi:O-antigen/teichoic acid export membrane protein